MINQTHLIYKAAITCNASQIYSVPPLTKHLAKKLNKFDLEFR